MSKPMGAFVLLLLGGILILLDGIRTITASIAIEVIPGESASRLIFDSVFLGLGVLRVIFGVLVIAGAVVVNSGNLRKVVAGSVLGILFSALNLYVEGVLFTEFIFIGPFIGFILALIGGVLGLTWKPEKTTPLIST